ncbi:MAG: NAD(P)H-dependent oxidoreductase subunit E [Rhodobiaceae bacterium]|nr:NAD(P)H-dependent oxidoreductase subunit E [Rhodobiaceae bacterium]MCC0048833.1 NAD(P)H-dependent oxidoreductase subunit E [Rhodobiaceae bacterium]
MANPYLKDDAPGGGVDPATAAEAVCARHGNDPAALLEILHELQHDIGCTPQAALPAIANALNISRAEVHGVVSFYHDFHETPGGRITVKICRAEACQSMGALKLIEAICRRNGIALGETSADKRITIEPVYCLGNCALSPAAMVNGRLHGRLDETRLQAAIDGAAT